MSKIMSLNAPTQGDADQDLLQAAIEASLADHQAGQVQFSPDGSSDEEYGDEDEELLQAIQLSKADGQHDDQARVLKSILELCNLMDVEPQHQVTISDSIGEFFKDCPNGTQNLKKIDFEKLSMAYITLDGAKQQIVKKHLNQMFAEAASSSTNTLNTVINLSMSSDEQFKDYMLQVQHLKKEEEKLAEKKPDEEKAPAKAVAPVKTTVAKNVEVIDLTQDEPVATPAAASNSKNEQSDKRNAFLLAFEKRQQELKAQQDKKEEAVQPAAKRSKPDAKK